MQSFINIIIVFSTVIFNKHAVLIAITIIYETATVRSDDTAKCAHAATSILTNFYKIRYRIVKMSYNVHITMNMIIMIVEIEVLQDRKNYMCRGRHGCKRDTTFWRLT